jgi:hypothetical protein
MIGTLATLTVVGAIVTLMGLGTDHKGDRYSFVLMVGGMILSYGSAVVILALAGW